MFKFVYKNLDISHKLGISSYPEDEYSKHVHYHYELIFICKGNLEYSIDGDTHLLKEGNIVLVHPGQIHLADVKNEDNYERYVLKFSESILPPFLNEKLSNFGSYFNGKSKYSIIFKNFDDYFKNFESDEEKYSFTQSIAGGGSSIMYKDGNKYYLYREVLGKINEAYMFSLPMFIDWNAQYL